MQPYTKLEITPEAIVEKARSMREAGITLVMIHAHREKDGAHTVCYEYAVGAGIESYQCSLPAGKNTLPSISAIYDAAAAWPEKEIEELLELRFEGLDMPGRLFLPEDMFEEQGQILVTPLKDLRAIREAKGREAEPEAAEDAQAEA